MDGSDEDADGEGTTDITDRYDPAHQPHSDDDGLYDDVPIRRSRSQSRFLESTPVKETPEKDSHPDTASSSSSDGDTSEGEAFRIKTGLQTFSRLSIGRRSSQASVIRAKSQTPFGREGTTPIKATTPGVKRQKKNGPKYNKLTEIYNFDQKTRSQKPMKSATARPKQTKKAKCISPSDPERGTAKMRKVDHSIDCACWINRSAGFMVLCDQCKKWNHGPCIAWVLPSSILSFSRLTQQRIIEETEEPVTCIQCRIKSAVKVALSQVTATLLKERLKDFCLFRLAPCFGSSVQFS